MDKIVICKHCGKPEYYGEMRWLSGRCSCRNCYKSQWQDENHKLYKWNDLDGKRPTPCDKAYYIVDKNNPKYAAVMRKSIRDLTVYEIENIDIDGRYFSTEELAEAKLKELRGNND